MGMGDRDHIGERGVSILTVKKIHRILSVKSNVHVGIEAKRSREPQITKALFGYKAIGKKNCLPRIT